MHVLIRLYVVEYHILNYTETQKAHVKAVAEVKEWRQGINIMSDYACDIIGPRCIDLYCSKLLN